MNQSARTFLVAATLLAVSNQPTLWAQDDEALTPIVIAEVARDHPVDFSKDIYPLLKKNCIACHNSSKARAKLNLESPKAILKGGSEGPAVEPGKPDESLLLILAAHQEDPVMPPEKNKANAVPFTSDELGLIKLWIAEGAKGESTVITATPTEWMAPKRTDYPVYHLAMSPNDDYVAASRGTRAFVYDLRQQGLASELIDPDLAKDAIYEGAPVAHRDFVQSMAFSKDGWIATGGFRNVKIWQPSPTRTTPIASMPDKVTAVTVTPDGHWAASADAAGHVRLWQPEDADFAAVQTKAHETAVSSLSFTPDGQWLTSSADAVIKILKTPNLAEHRAVSNAGPVRGALAVPALHALVAGADDGHLRVWPFPNADGAPKTHKVSEQALATLTELPNQPLHVLIGGADGVAREWHVGEAKEVRAFKHEEPIRCLAASADGQRLVTVGEKSAKLWNGQDGTLVTALPTNAVRLQSRQLTERRTAAANKMVETRKKKIEDADKTWKAEVEKAKKAAVDELVSKKAFDEKDQAAHQARLLVDAPVKREATAKEKVDQAKAALATAEKIAKEAGDLKAMAASLDDTRLKLTEATAEVTKATQALTEKRSTKAKIRESLAMFRQLPNAEDAIYATETLLARCQMNETAVTLKVTEATNAQHALQAKVNDLEKIVSGVDQAKAELAKTEEALKPFTEAAKKAKEVASKADNERDAAAKAFKQAEENRELSLRLANRASETHGRATAALGAAEDVLKRGKEAEDAAKKAEAELPKLATVSFTNDGNALSLALDGGAWQTWSAESGRFLHQEDTSKATALAGLPGGDWLIGNAEMNVQRLSAKHSWALRRVIGAIEDPKSLVDRVTALAFSPTGTLLATGSGSPSRSGELKIWRVSDGTMLVDKSEAHSDTIVGLEFSPDGRFLATASTDRFAKVFRVDDGELVAAFEGHTSHVLDVSWRADGLVLATCGADNVIKLWDFEEKRQMKTIDGYNKEITSVAFADVNETLVTSSGDNSVRFGKDKLDGKEFVYASAMSQGGEWIVAGSQDSVVRVWNAKDKTLVSSFQPPAAPSGLR